MKVVVLDYYKNDNNVREVNPLSAFYSYLSEDNNQDAPDTHSHIMNIYHILWMNT